MFYAVINKNNICEEVKMTKGKIDLENHIEVSDMGDYIWRKYENGEWSADKYEPVSTAPLNEFEKLKKDLELAQRAINDLILGGM